MRKMLLFDVFFSSMNRIIRTTISYELSLKFEVSGLWCVCVCLIVGTSICMMCIDQSIISSEMAWIKQFSYRLSVLYNVEKRQVEQYRWRVNKLLTKISCSFNMINNNNKRNERIMATLSDDTKIERHQNQLKCEIESEFIWFLEWSVITLAEYGNAHDTKHKQNARKM